MDRLAAIRTFCTLAEAESFVAAARALRLSPGVISKRVSALEDEIGARLVQRNPRSAALTAAGLRLYERCAPALGDLAAAVEEAQSAAGEPRGLVRVAAPHHFAAACIAPHLAAFAARCPEVRLEIDALEREVDLIDEGFDVAIQITAGLPESRLVARRLARCPVVLCGAPAYLEHHGEPATVAALAGHACLAAPAQLAEDGVRIALANRRVHIVATRARLASASQELLRAAALAGAGLAILPAFLVADDLRRGRLRAVLADCPLAELEVYALYPSRRHLSPGVRAFVDFLAATLDAPVEGAVHGSHE